MAHYAKLDAENNVVDIHTINDSDELTTETDTSNWLISLFGGTKWVKTSYNTTGNTHTLDGTPFRKNYACIGGVYDESKNAFYQAQPFASWTLNNDTCLWHAPHPIPNDDKMYIWNESSYQEDNTTGWEEITE
jgi:hypothetical protein